MTAPEPATMQSRGAMWEHAPSGLRAWGHAPLAGERSGADD